MRASVFMRLVLAVAVGFVLAVVPSSAGAENPKEATTIERVTEKPVKNSEGLGTNFYAASKEEQPYFAKLPRSERVTGGLSGDYDISKKDAKYVGWFGVVREVKEHPDKNETELLVEHKYFDGLTDSHIMALSFNGSGDFKAALKGVGMKIQPLSLVKVYGVVAQSKAGAMPEVKADFVRNWEWGTFTFIMASGTQRGSEKWRKLNKVKLDDIYKPYPDDRYYEQRLGKRQVAKQP